MSKTFIKLTPKQLYTPCPLKSFDFETTADVKPLDGVIGQPRAVESIRFAIGMPHDGYNLFAFGREGTGKTSIVRRFIENEAKDMSPPDGWCYVNNFKDSHKPLWLRLPPGKSDHLHDDMKRLIEELQDALPSAFQGEDYTHRKNALEDELKEQHEDAFAKLQARAKEHEFALVRSALGFGLAPTKDGEVTTPDEFKALSQKTKNKRIKELDSLQEELDSILVQIPKTEKQHREKLRALNRETTQRSVDHLIEELKKSWNSFEPVMTYLEDVRNDVIEHAADFITSGDQQQQIIGMPNQNQLAGQPGAFRRYQVNVLVDRSLSPGDKAAGVPVIKEDYPTQPNLVGRIEHLSHMGNLMTDFNLIKGGALHQANGGYLILDARRVLMQPYAWESLKRSLRSGHIRIEGLAESMGFATTISLEPEPIPLDIKVILLGEPMIYFLLSMHDPDFKELFKVSADFSDQMERDQHGVNEYARLVAAQVEQENIRHLDRSGVARIVEQGARMASHAEKLTTHMASIVDLMREANYWAGTANAKFITADHVQEAIDTKIYRSNRYCERLQEEIQSGTLVIETEGAKVGQINALSVIQLDSFMFGRPSRISATVHMGKGEVIDIERQVELGGPLHSKGVMILESYLTSHYGQQRPLILSARITFEQSYGGIEGDSASSTELYALLSAISGIPIQQGIAVTGSIDQYGMVQAIGGVNEKIEGFFDICMQRGLTGDQGVIIPSSNVKHLMLRTDVIAAVKDKKFNIWSVKNVDQGIEILTGSPMGTANSKGNFPMNSVNYAVTKKLRQYAKALTPFAVQAAQPTNTIIKVQSDRDN